MLNFVYSPLVSEYPMVLNTALWLWPDNLQIKVQGPFPALSAEVKSMLQMLQQAVQILCPSGPCSGATSLGQKSNRHKS